MPVARGAGGTPGAPALDLDTLAGVVGVLLLTQARWRGAADGAPLGDGAGVVANGVAASVNGHGSRGPASPAHGQGHGDGWAAAGVPRDGPSIDQALELLGLALLRAYITGGVRDRRTADSGAAAATEAAPAAPRG